MAETTSWVKARQTKFAAYTAVYVLIVLAAVGVLNFLANRYDKTYDATASKQFTMSDQTIKIAKNLKQEASISYWDNPTQFPAARDLLERYKNLSSKIDVQYQDLDKNITKARAAGVTRRGAVLVDVGGRHQEAKSLSEEEVTGALVRALKTGDKVVCFVTGSGEHALDDSDRTGYTNLKTLIEGNNYKTQSVSFAQKPEIPKECTIAVVAGPTRDYRQQQADALKTYVEQGGRAVFLLDPPLQFGGENVDENAALNGVLAGWGVTVNKDLIVDPISEASGLGAEMPIIQAFSTHPIVRDMKRVAVVFRLARTLNIKNADKTTVEKLFESSDESLGTGNMRSAAFKQEKKGPFVLAAAGTYNAGKDSDGNGRFVVAGSSGWAMNGMLRLSGNRDLFLNMLNWLSADEDLISIRPKEPEERRLNMNRNQMALVFYSSVLAIPLLILIAGVSVWWKRR